MEKEKGTLKHKLANIIGLIMCIVAIPILIVNIMLITKSIIESNKAPDFAGYLPLVTLTDSMNPEIKGGDLMIMKVIEGDEAEIGDIIAFYDPDSKKRSITTHRVIGIKYDDDGNKMYETKGDANNAADRTPVPAENVFALYLSKVDRLGNVVIFVQTPVGVTLLVILPALLFVMYDSGKKYLYAKKVEKENEVLKKENENLKAEIAALNDLKSEVNTLNSTS